MDQVSIYLPGIILAYSVFLLEMMSPGPNILTIIGTSMSVGRASGIPLALGIGTGSFVWSTLTVVGLSTLITSYAGALMIIKVCGGLYLIWLACKSFRSAMSTHDIEVKGNSDPCVGPFQYFLRGLTIQMTNPKAAFAWIAIISLGLQANAPFWVGLSIVIGTGALSVFLHCMYAIAFSTAPMVRVYGKARRTIQGGLGLFLAFAGIKLIASRS